MKVLRSTVVAAVAFVAVACGDKVTVAGPPATDTTPTVNSVSVAPATATLNVGQTVTFSAAVNASNGAATTVTWASSDPSKVSMSGAVATAVASTPGVAICATSTVDTGKQGCASVAVTAATTVIPATVQIQSVTTGAAGQPSIPAAGAAGIIDVRLSVSPGNQTVSKVVLVVGGIRIDSQVYTAAQSAALRYAADQAAETQATPTPIVFNINTAAYNTTTGAVTFTNGLKTISAQLYTTGTSAAATATAQTSVLFTNVDGWHASVATSGTTANALNAGGFRYDRGALTVSAIPVSYTGGTMASGTTTFGSGCDASGTGARTATLVAPVAPSAAWTATFSQTAAAGATNVNGYEFDAGLCALNAVGETPTVTGVNGAGDALFAAAAPINAGAVTGTRLDNRAPLVPTLIQNPNSRANGWINAAVALTSLNTSATSNGVMIAPAAQAGCATAGALDCGVATTVRMARVAASATGTVSEARSATASNTPALPAPSATNLTYCGIFTYQDALGNEAALPAAATVCSAPAAVASTALAANHMLLGVDIAQPTIAYTAASIAASARLAGAAIGGEFIVTVNDTGLVGNSGMLPTGPVKMQLTRRAIGAANSAGTSTKLDATGVAAAAAETATGVVAAAPLYSTVITALAGAANHAYWSHTATASDAAGNTVAVAGRTMVYDFAAPVPGVPTAPLTITATGFSTSAFINEDLDIQDYSFGTTYAAMVLAPKVIQQALVPVNGFNAATFSNTNFLVTTTVNLPLAIQANVAAGLAPITGITTTSRAQSNLAATSGAFAPVTVTPGAGLVLTNWTTFPAPTAPATIVGVTSGFGAAANATNPTSTTITATVTGTTAVFNNPFSRMDLYMLNAAGTQWFFVGTASVAALNDDGATRTFSYTFTLSGAAAYAAINGTPAALPIASSILVLGVNANGNVAMEPVGLLAFAVR
jgi:hypothetical protein